MTFHRVRRIEAGGRAEELAMVRYGFNIRTKTGQRVDNILILAASLGDAERRLRQMYLQCEIIERREQSVARRGESADAHTSTARIDIRATKHNTGTQ
jgi:hypothetical protein